MNELDNRPTCVVAGVGPGNGEAFARRFAAESYNVALLARRKDRIEALAGELPNARAFACDVTDAASVDRAFLRPDRRAAEVGRPGSHLPSMALSAINAPPRRAPFLVNRGGGVGRHVGKANALHPWTCLLRSSAAESDRCARITTAAFVATSHNRGRRER